MIQISFPISTINTAETLPNITRNINYHLQSLKNSKIEINE